MLVDSPSQEGSEKKYSQVTTSILKEGDVVEMLTYEGKKRGADLLHSSGWDFLCISQAVSLVLET